MKIPRSRLIMIAKDAHHERGYTEDVAERHYYDGKLTAIAQIIGVPVYQLIAMTEDDSV